MFDFDRSVFTHSQGELHWILAYKNVYATSLTQNCIETITFPLNTNNSLVIYLKNTY